VPLPPEQQPGQGKAPSSAVAHLHADARKQLAAKQYNGAASTLERALRIAPRNAELWHSLAVVRLQQQRWEMARNMAAKSNSLAAANRGLQAENWRVIANSHQAQGNQKAAQKAWQRARQLGGS
jgi:Flp pilus assembly protein TadD